MSTTFAEFVEQRFGGTLYQGAHDPNGHACLHEALNVYQGKPWSDDTQGTIDLRELNDAPWSSDAARTAAMVPLGPLVLAWPDWTPDQRRSFAEYVAEQTIRRILPPMLRALANRIPAHSPELVAAALRCEDEGSRAAARAASEASEAAREAASAAEREAAWAAREAASAAAWAAREAASAAEREAAWAATRAASEAAWAATRAASAAAWAASEAASAAAREAASAAEWAGDAPLQEACRIFTEGWERA